MDGRTDVQTEGVLLPPNHGLGLLPGDNKQGDINTRWVCLDEEVEVKLLSERGNRREHTNLIRKGIPHSWSNKSKTINCLTDF